MNLLEAFLSSVMVVAGVIVAMWVKVSANIIFKDHP